MFRTVSCLIVFNVVGCSVSVEELLKHTELDKDLDGEFTPQEAKVYNQGNITRTLLED
jgi:hypothetical protein